MVSLEANRSTPSTSLVIKMNSYSIWILITASQWWMSHKLIFHWSHFTAVHLKRCPLIVWIPVVLLVSMPKTRRTLSHSVWLLVWLCRHPRRSTPSSHLLRVRARTMDLRVTAVTTACLQPTFCPWATWKTVTIENTVMSLSSCKTNVDSATPLLKGVVKNRFCLFFNWKLELLHLILGIMYIVGIG